MSNREPVCGIWQYGDSCRLPLQEFRALVASPSCVYCRTDLTTIHEDSGFTRHDVHNSSQQLIRACDVCGWWTVRNTWLLQDDYTGREKFFGAAGTLRELNLADLRTPISEARSYLLAKYADRYNIHPRLLEQIVGDIFKSLGYMTVVTAYANDGGIDVFLERDGVLVGVQVKRHRASIDVEQIRSLAGAMVLRGLTEGIFVTTSRFRSGAHKAVDAYEQAGYKIQLINATHLYDALKLTRGTGCRSKEEFHERYKMLSLRPLDSDYRDSATIAEG